METVTLGYTFGGGTVSQDFSVYSVNWLDADLKFRTHELLNGGLSEDIIGYRYRVTIDFPPMVERATEEEGKTDLYWLHGFVTGTARTITYGAETRNVIVENPETVFDYLNNVSFGNSLTLELTEQSLRTFTDDETTKILKPLYPNISAVEGISGDTLSIVASLVDDGSATVFKRNLNFVDSSEDDAAFGYRHDISIKLPAVKDATWRTWLLEFCLRKNKQIDTTGLTSTQGKVYDVVNGSGELRWTFQNGLSETPAISLTFQEKTLRTELEAAV